MCDPTWRPDLGATAEQAELPLAQAVETGFLSLEQDEASGPRSAAVIYLAPLTTPPLDLSAARNPAPLGSLATRASPAARQARRPDSPSTGAKIPRPSGRHGELIGPVPP